MSYLREDEVVGLATRHVLAARLGKSLDEIAASRQAEVFLAHSSQDAGLVADVVAWLETQGVLVYIDERDPEMSAFTSPKTAVRLRDKIRSCRRMMVLATNRALASRWVPWEIGFADGVKGPMNVVILPLADRAGRWDGNEYVGIYPVVEKNPHGSWVIPKLARANRSMLLSEVTSP